MYVIVYQIAEDGETRIHTMHGMVPWDKPESAEEALGLFKAKFGPHLAYVARIEGYPKNASLDV